MSIKIYCILAFSLTLLGCVTNDGKNTAQNNSIQEKLIMPYKHFEYSNVSSIMYSPTSDITDCSSNTNFVRNLLFSLDSTLAESIFEVLICDEVIITDVNDTLNITIYDFVGSQENIGNVFSESNYIDKFIGMYKFPVSCRFILVDENLCSICKNGISIDKRIDDSLFLEYIENSVHARLKQK